jgi:hypothetical protein
MRPVITSTLAAATAKVSPPARALVAAPAAAQGNSAIAGGPG